MGKNQSAFDFGFFKNNCVFPILAETPENSLLFAAPSGNELRLLRAPRNIFVFLKF